MLKQGMLVLVLLACAGCCGGRQVRLHQGKPETTTICRLDPDLFADRVRKLQLGIELPVPVTPQIGFLDEVRMVWNAHVQVLIARYMMLVADMNAGVLALNQYMDRRNELDKLLEELALDKVRLERAIAVVMAEKTLTIDHRVALEGIMAGVKKKMNYRR